MLNKLSHEQLRVLTIHCNAEDDPKEWPGPKAWPATLALISFFAVNVFGQVLVFSLHAHPCGHVLVKEAEPLA